MWREVRGHVHPLPFSLTENPRQHSTAQREGSARVGEKTTEQLGAEEDGVALSPVVFCLHHHPRLGAEDTSNLEAPVSRPKLPTKLSLWPRGQERPSQRDRRLTD